MRIATRDPAERRGRARPAAVGRLLVAEVGEELVDLEDIHQHVA